MTFTITTSHPDRADGTARFCADGQWNLYAINSEIGKAATWHEACA